jgi:N-acetylmuramoyl-L-alanine amidase
VPELIVIHYTGMESCAAAQARLCDPAAEVSAHWLVDADGSATPLVDEALRAWHAGSGSWQGRGDVNSRSVGIEVHNDGRAPFAARQMRALADLLDGVMARWSIGPAGVIGHSDMAPARKSDPGPHFDWLWLARQGLAVWPMAGKGDPAEFLRDALAFGYPALEEGLVLRSFRLRFRPWAAGPVDAADAGLARDLAARFGVDRAGPGA